MHDCVGCSFDYFMMSGHTRVWSEILTNLQQGSGDRRLVMSFVCFYLCFRYVFYFILRPTNIYKEPAVYEVKRALPVITELRTRIKELLLEWPDHPGLKQVMSKRVNCPISTHSNAFISLE